jgi:predicted esterase
MPAGLGGEAALFVPSGYLAAKPAPLMVMLHGAGGRPDDALSMVRSQAERDGVFLLAPGSRASTWDVIRGGFGPDLRLLDAALAWTFDRYAIDPDRIAVGGFSDGASYALSVGLGNGELFSDALAFSPGFAAPGAVIGKPRIYISHGRRDDVLPYARCGEALARRLKAAGYDVLFQPFAEGHIVPAECVEAALRRFLG